MSEAMDLEKISKSVAPKAAGRDPSEYAGMFSVFLNASLAYLQFHLESYRDILNGSTHNFLSSSSLRLQEFSAHLPQLLTILVVQGSSTSTPSLLSSLEP